MYIYLDIVRDFSCGMCGRCCRNAWMITLDKASFDRNARLFAQLGKPQEFAQAFIRLEKKESPGEFACIAKRDGSCWFLAADNSCQLQRIAGHDHLDPVCRFFPRYPMATSRGLEITLSFACPTVVKLAERAEPLEIVRSDMPPTPVSEDSCVLAVYPAQKPEGHPLRYYFELEHHFVDILQWRALAIPERIEWLRETAERIEGLEPGREMGSRISRIIDENYRRMDAAAEQQRSDLMLADHLLENFFVSMLFKKPGYLFGLRRTAGLIGLMWEQIKITLATGDAADRLERTRQAVMEAEFCYSHDRRKLKML